MDIPGYDDLEAIGRGGFGTVYRARQQGVPRPVAIKVMSDAGARRLDDKSRRRFQRETETTGRLSAHPHIITVHEAGFTDTEQPYLVMALMEQGSLGDVLQQRGPLRWQEVLDIGVQLAGALATAHEAGIVHRDVKPDNVLIDDFGAPVLTDFGLASVRGAQTVTETADGRITGTVAYAPPEVLEGTRPGPAGDVYALAATLFALLHGTPPFVRPGDESFAPIIARTLREDPPDLRPQGVPDAVCAALERALRRDLSVRTPSALAFGQDLQEAQRSLGLPVTRMILPAGSSAEADGERTLRLPQDRLSATSGREASQTGPDAQAAAAAVEQTPPPARRPPTETPPAAPAPAHAQAPWRWTDPDPAGQHPSPARGGRGAFWAVALATVLLAGAAGALALLLVNREPARQPATSPPPQTVASGPTTTEPSQAAVSVPDVRGQPVGDARAALLAAGFADVIVIERPVPPGTAEPGTVLSQQPAAGTTAPAQQQARLSVAVQAAAPTATPRPTPLAVTVTAAHPRAMEVAATLRRWAGGINTDSYEAAFAQYTPRLQDRVGFEEFAAGNATSTIFDPEVRQVDGDGDVLVATIGFVSRQDASLGPDGQTCSVWVLRWRLVPSDGRLLVDDSDAVPPHPVAC